MRGRAWEVHLPSRTDFQRLIEWCDGQSPFQWLQPVAGAALAVHPITPIGTPSPPATALCSGELSLATPGAGELLFEPVQFRGTLVGARNPERQVEVQIEADADRVVSKLKAPGLDPAWAAGLEVEHVRDQSGLLRADWTLGSVEVVNQPPAEDFPQFFELLLWPALRRHLLITGPP
jgi:hypothetical protein